MLRLHRLPATNLRERRKDRAAYDSSSGIPNKPSGIWPNCTNSTCEGLGLSCAPCTRSEDDEDTGSGEQLKQGAEDTAAGGQQLPQARGMRSPRAMLPCATCTPHAPALPQHLPPDKSVSALLPALAESGI